MLAFPPPDFNFLVKHRLEALFRSAHQFLSLSYRRSPLCIPKYLTCKVKKLPKFEQASCITQTYTLASF